ncbi:MAG: DUF1648 domain-containing protein [Bacteroidetes bacterium]|nr:DUF1648 domain-containing protein [Bacteroidota bacterium]
MQKTSLIIKVLNVIILVFHWVFVVFYFFKLPNIIPIHFDLDGNVDGYGSKKSIILLPIISTGIFFLLQYMSKNPYAPGLNIPDEMRENPQLTELFLQSLCLLCLLMFVSIDWEITQVAVGKIPPQLFMPIVLLVLMFIMMFVFFYIAKRIKKNKLKNNLS